MPAATTNPHSCSLAAHEMFFCVMKLIRFGGMDKKFDIPLSKVVCENSFPLCPLALKFVDQQTVK